MVENDISKQLFQDWALRLYSKSPLKQKKFAMISKLAGDWQNLTCLDVGSDNGVISLLLRRAGGVWYSADLIPETVAAIESLVGERVVQIGEGSLPFDSSKFDMVVIVDFLEHIQNDVGFVEELYRIIKAGGTLLINVPNPKEGLLRKIRFALGQTDQKHGHLRPGYSPEDVARLLQGKFKIETSQSYSRIFAELIDTLINFGLGFFKKSGSRKGTLVTKADLKKMQKSFRVFSLLYPVIWIFAKLDNLVPFLRGNMLILRARSLKV